MKNVKQLVHAMERFMILIESCAENDETVWLFFMEMKERNFIEWTKVLWILFYFWEEQKWNKMKEYKTKEIVFLIYIWNHNKILIGKDWSNLQRIEIIEWINWNQSVIKSISL